MIWSLEELSEMDEFSDIDSDVLERNMRAIESAIRAYTNNNFHNRSFKMLSDAQNGKIKGFYPLFVIGDTVEITQSKYNDGLYVITFIDGEYIALDKQLNDENNILITKVVYPDDVKIGVLQLLKWNMGNYVDKVGISSETLSRHSVSYTKFNSDEFISGYPKTLMNFCNNYRKMQV